jgi:hypothetical protein
MFTRQVPASTMLVDAQCMAGSEMASDHLATPAAFEADDIIAMNRSPDRHGGCPLTPGFAYRFTTACEGLMNSRDKDRQLVRPNLIAADICSNDVGREFSVERWRRRFVWHFGSPLSRSTKYHAGQN